MYRRVWPTILVTAIVFFALGTLFGARVLSVRTDENSASIQVDKDRLKAAVKTAAEKTEKAGEKIIAETKDAVENVSVEIKEREGAARPTSETTD